MDHERLFYTAFVARMQTHEAANLRRTYAATGQLDQADITTALAELETLLAERAKAGWLLGRLAEQFPALRDGLQELSTLFDGDAAVPELPKTGDRVMFNGQLHEVTTRFPTGPTGPIGRIDLRMTLLRVTDEGQPRFGPLWNPVRDPVAE